MTPEEKQDKLETFAGLYYRARQELAQMADPRDPSGHFYRQTIDKLACEIRGLGGMVVPGACPQGTSSSMQGSVSVDVVVDAHGQPVPNNTGT